MSRFRRDSFAILLKGELEFLPEVFGAEVGGLIRVVGYGWGLGAAFLFGIRGWQHEADSDDDRVSTLMVCRKGLLLGEAPAQFLARFVHDLSERRKNFNFRQMRGATRDATGCLFEVRVEELSRGLIVALAQNVSVVQRRRSQIWLVRLGAGRDQKDG
jgi:hypothetical protein